MTITNKWLTCLTIPILLLGCSDDDSATAETTEAESSESSGGSTNVDTGTAGSDTANAANDGSAGNRTMASDGAAGNSSADDAAGGDDDSASDDDAADNDAADNDAADDDAADGDDDAANDDDAADDDSDDDSAADDDDSAADDDDSAADDDVDDASDDDSAEGDAGVNEPDSQGDAGTQDLNSSDLLSPEEVELVELDIPDLPGCESPYPHDPAVDLRTGVVYWPGSNESCVGKYDPETDEYTAWPTLTPESYPIGVDVDEEGRVFYAAGDTDLIGILTPETGEIVEYDADCGVPHTVYIQDGLAWYTCVGSGQYGVLDPSTGEVTSYDFSSSRAQAYGMWPAPDGSLWVALFGTNRIARINTEDASAEEFELPNEDSRPRRIAVDDAGKVYYTDYPRRRLGRYDPDAPEGERFSEWETPGGGQPYGIVIGPDGRVWFDDQDAPELVAFDQASEQFVRQITVAADLTNPGPIRNMDVDRVRNRIWVAISNVGRLGYVQF